MEVDDLLDVGKAETEAFDIVHVTCVNAVELVEYLLHVLLFDALSCIADAEAEMLLLVPRADIEVERLVGLTVFHRVIHQVGDGILEMHLIDIDGRIDSLDLGIDLTACMLHAQ